MTVSIRTSIQQRLALVDPPVWEQLPALFTADAWLPISEQLAAYREQAVERGDAFTSTLRVTATEMAAAAGPVLALLELLAAFDLVDVIPKEQ